MKKTILSLCAVAVSLLWQVSAAELSADAALERALSGGRRHAPSMQKASYKLAYSKPGALYVFNAEGKGFLAVSADDCAPAVLGYSDTSTFDAEAMPPQLQWWLGEYGRQIEAMGAYAKAPDAAKAPQGEIKPMLTTTWNQNAPYNNKCPEIDGKRSMTGCVATAMAQVLNYHKWPEKGVSYHSYKTATAGKTVSLSFTNTTFDWANMRDNYSRGSSNQAQIDAIATLMFACGVSVDMDYMPSSSGAQSGLVVKALPRYFNYDKGIRLYERDFYGLVEWQNIIYDQLKNYGPVYYSGANSEIGHAFVVDGYSSDGYFHLNWGWNGMSDGYFLLTALDPGQQGIGGSSAGYNFYQQVVGNVSKPREGSTVYYNVSMWGSMGVKQSTARLGTAVTITGGVYNYSPVVLSGTIGAKLVNTASGEVTYAVGFDFSDLGVNYGWAEYDVTVPTGLASGEYRMTPAFITPDGNWQDIPVKITGTSYINVSVSGTTATFSAPAPPSITGSDLRLLSDLYIGEAFHMKATLANNGETEFYGNIVPALLNASGKVVARGDTYLVDLEPGTTFELDYMGSMDDYSGSSAPAAGSYTLVVADASTGNIVCPGIPVEAKRASGKRSVRVADFKFNGNPEQADPDNLSFSGTVNCTSGFFGGALDLIIFPAAGGYSLDQFGAEPVFIAAGQSAPFEAKGVFGAAEDGKRYMCYVYDTATSNSSAISEPVFITIKRNTGIEAPEAEAEVTMTRVFNPAGVIVMQAEGEVSTDALAAGVYIVEKTTADGKRSVSRVAVTR